MKNITNFLDRRNLLDFLGISQKKETISIGNINKYVLKMYGPN